MQKSNIRKTHSCSGDLQFSWISPKTLIAVLLLVGCGPSKYDLALIDATESGNIQAVKQYLAYGADVNARGDQFGGQHCMERLDMAKRKSLSYF